MPESDFIEIERQDIENYLRTWFPISNFVKCAEICNYPLLDEEYQFIRNSTERRKKEFSTGRFLSRQGLQALELPEIPIKIGRLYNPIWPEAVVGSITHDGDLCAVVISAKTNCHAKNIGIDLVNLSNQHNNIQGLSHLFISDSSEYQIVSNFSIRINPDLLIFSLKEAAVKAISLEINDFIDIKSIRLSEKDCSKVTVAGMTFNIKAHVAISQDYLISAIIVK